MWWGESLEPKATAVVAYLALHRSVTTERLEEACWVGCEEPLTSHRTRRSITTELRSTWSCYAESPKRSH